MKKPTHRPIRRALSAAALSAGLLVSSGALALDMEDILNLQAAGLDAGTIVTVIRSSTEPLTVTADEVETLRAAGVAQPVLDELCLRVGCGAPQAPGPVSPGGVGPDLQREMELQRAQEEERLRLERERYEAERERMREAMEAERAREAQTQAAFQGLTVADRQFSNREYLRAAQTYRDFLTSIAPAPGSAEHTEALSGFVRSMHAAGFRYAIRREALEATLAGPTNPAFPEMFGILVDVANDTGFLDPGFERLTGFQVGTFETRFQDEWFYFLGRFFREYADYPRAMELLSRVSEGSERKAQAEFLTGQMAIARGENRRAMDAFRKAILATEANDSDPSIAELANLAIARVAYEVGNFDVALYHYRKIPFESSRHPEAVFETAWTYTLKQDWNRAVGALHSLHSPYYQRWFFPELYVIEAYAYLSTCNLDEAQTTVAAFGEQLGTLRGPVQEFIASDRTPEDYYDAIATYHARMGTPEAVPLPLEAVRSVLTDAELVRSLRLIEHLRSERARLQRNSERLGSFADAAVASIDGDLQLRTIEAGILIQSLLFEFHDELTDWYVSSQEVAIDVRTEILNVFDAALEGMGIDTASSGSVFVLAQDWQYWPFEGEYWVDEVDAYRANLRELRDPESGRCMSVDVNGSDAAQ